MMRHLALLLLLGLVTLLAPSPSVAQEDGSRRPQELIEEVTPSDDFVAPVTIDGVELFIVRGTTVLPAHERARTVEGRIIQLAETPGDAPPVIRTVTGELGIEILVNGQRVTMTTIADAEQERIELEVLAALQAEAIRLAILNYRADRTDEARVQSTISAIAWTAGFLLVSFLFFRLRHRGTAALCALVERYFIGVEAATQSIVKGQAVARLVGYGLNVVLWISYFFAIYYYLSFVLLAFAETRPFAQILLTYLSEPLVGVFWGLFGFLPNVITLIIIALVTRYIIRGFRIYMDNVEAGTFDWPKFEPHWITPTYNIGRFVIIVIALVFAYPHIPGSDSRAFQGLAIVAGVMVSLGSNAVVSNIMAGLFVIYRRSTNVGDRIRVGEQVGDVIEIKLMETLIKSTKNEMVSIPNSSLLASEVVNFSRTIDGRGLVVHTTVGIGYEEPRAKVEAMLIAAADRTEGLKKTPRPFVLITGLADYAVNYQINAFTTRGSHLPRLLSDLHSNVLDVFHENGVQIMTPSYEEDPSEPKIPVETWDGRLAEPTAITAKQPGSSV